MPQNRHAISVRMNNGEQIFTGRLDERFVANGVVGFAAKAPRAPDLRRWNSMSCHFIHHGSPSSPRHFGVVRREVGASEIKIEGRLPLRFIHRVEQAFGFASMARSEGSLFC